MKKLKGIVSHFLMLPAIVIGTIAMVSYGVPTSIWIQNSLIWIMGTVFGAVFLIQSKEKQFNNGRSSQIIMILVLLILPFFFNGLEGVHRWLVIGPINLYIASIVLPLLIIQLWKINNRDYYVFGTNTRYIHYIVVSTRCRAIIRICLCRNNHSLEKDC